MKTNTLSTAISLTLLQLLLSSQGFARGGEGNVGNGGYAYRYLDAQGVQRLEMVDYWEATNTVGLEPIILAPSVHRDETWVEKAHRLIGEIRSQDIEMGEFLLTSLERFESPAFSMSSDPSWGPSTEPRDINASFAPNNGTEELAVYQLDQPGPTGIEFVRTPLFDELCDTQKLVAFLHESIYRERKDIDPDSRVTRIVTKFILSNQIKKAKSALGWGETPHLEEIANYEMLATPSKTGPFEIPTTRWREVRQFSLLESLWRHWEVEWDEIMETGDSSWKDPNHTSTLLNAIQTASPTSNIIPFGIGDSMIFFKQSTKPPFESKHFDGFTFELVDGPEEIRTVPRQSILGSFKGQSFDLVSAPKPNKADLGKLLFESPQKDRNQKIAREFCIATIVQAWLVNGSFFTAFGHLAEYGYSDFSKVFPLQTLKVVSVVAQDKDYILALKDRYNASEYTAKVKGFWFNGQTSVTKDKISCAFDQIKITRSQATDQNESFIYKYDN